MLQTARQGSGSAPAVLGLLLILVGGAALVLRAADINLLPTIGRWGWPFFIIVPGVVLLLAALLPAPPRGIGFATAGAIVTTVGGLLLYQNETGHWESWAYAWALIPTDVGIAMALYGLLARERGMVTSGLWMAAIGAILLAAGAWFFEGLFAGEPRMVDAGSWWPIAVIVVGALLMLRAVLVPSSRVPAAPASGAAEGTSSAPTPAGTPPAGSAPAGTPPEATFESRSEEGGPA